MTRSLRVLTDRLAIRRPTFSSVAGRLSEAWPLLLVLLAGLGIFVWKVRIVAPIKYVGHADAAAYAEMADSILKGRGLAVDYISWYFRHYDREIVRPEDHWPPFYSFLIVPFFAVMGKTAFAAKLPSLLISAFAFPLVVYLLGWRVVRSRAVAFAAAISMLLYYPVFSWSLHSLSDVTFGFLVTAAVYGFVRGLDDSRWFYVMGAFLAAAYYSKGSTPVFLGAFVVYYVLWRVFRRPARRWTPRDRRFALGIGLFFLLLTPWFVRNLIHFGNPIYSTQNHASGYIGWKSWEEGTYTLYWGEKEPPSLGDKLHQPEKLVEQSTKFAKRLAWWLFMGMGRQWGNFDRKDISTYWTGIPAALGLLGFLGLSLFGLGLWIGRWRGRVNRALVDVWRWLRPFHRPEYGLFLLVGFVHLFFLAVAWEPISRLTTPVIPLIFIVGWGTLWTAVERALSETRAATIAATAVVLVLLGIWIQGERRDLLNARAKNGYPWREGAQGWMAVGRWIRENAPGSITMTRNPWELHFYSEEKAIQIPLAPLERIIEVARYYGATHLIPENRRPMLKPWIAGEIPGLEKVYASGGVALYRIDYGRLPPELLSKTEPRRDEDSP